MDTFAYRGIDQLPLLWHQATSCDRIADLIAYLYYYTCVWVEREQKWYHAVDRLWVESNLDLIRREMTGRVRRRILDINNVYEDVSRDIRVLLDLERNNYYMIQSRLENDWSHIMIALKSRLRK